MFEGRFGEMFDYGEGCANLLELSALSICTFYAAAWKRDVIDYTELASKRWVEKLNINRIAEELGWGRTAVIRYLGKIKENPYLVVESHIRRRIYRCKRKFMGRSS